MRISGTNAGTEHEGLKQTDALLPGFSLPISELFAMAEITTDEAVEQ